MSNQLAVVQNGAYAVGEKAYLTVDGVHRKVEKMYLSKKRKPKKLYEVLEYIESTGAQFIKTNYIPKANSTAVLVANISAANQYPTPFGARKSSGSEAFLVFPRHNNSNKLMADFGSGELEVGSTANLLGKKATITLKPNYVSMESEDGAKIEKSFTSGTPTSAYPLYLFTLNEANKDYGDVCHATMRFHSFDVDEEKEALRIIAVRRLSDGELGTYDRVNGEFQPNAGTGTFIAGPPTGEYIYDVEGENTAYHKVFEDLSEQLVNYTFLYEYGNEHTDVTGGWNGCQLYPNFPNGYATKYSDYMECGDASSTYGNGGIATANAVDLTLYTWIWASFLVASGNGDLWGGAGLGLNAAPAINAGTTIQRISSSAIGTPIKASMQLHTDDSTKKPLHGAFLTFSGASGGGMISLRCYGYALGKPDDWATLCSIAGVTAPADLATLIADTAAITAILSNEEAVLYMTRRCTGDFMMAFVTTAACRTALASSPYSSIVYENEHWNKFLSYST